MPHEHVGRGRYRRRSGIAWAGFLRAAAGNRTGMADRVAVRPCAGTRRVGGTGIARACRSWTVQASVWRSLGRVPARRCRQSAWYGVLVLAIGARARHKTRNTTDIRESCARLGVSRPTENGAFRCFKKAAPFSVARGAIFHNLLKQQKIAPGLDSESARSIIKDRLCCAIKQHLPLFNNLSRRYRQTGSKRAN